MSDVIVGICKARGINVGAAAAKEENDVVLLNDIKLLLEAKEVTAQASKKLNGELFPKLSAASPEAKTIVFDIYKLDPSAPASKMFKTAINEVRKSAKIDAPTKRRTIMILIDMVDASEKAEEAVKKLVAGLSPYSARTFRALSGQISVSQVIAQALPIVHRKLSEKYQKRIDLSRDDSKEVNREIRRICLSVEEAPRPRVEPRRVVPPKDGTPKTAKPKWYSKLDFSVRLDIGYGLAGGSDNKEILASIPRGVVPSGRLSGSYTIGPKLKLQADYRGGAAFGVVGADKKDAVTSNNDDARVSLFFSPGKILNGMVQLGWNNFRSDYPSVFTPDRNVGTLNSRFNIRPIAKPLSINVDETLEVGMVNTTFPIDQQFTVRALLKAGVSYDIALKALTLTPFAGGSAGYFMDREQMSGVAYGGYAGLGIIAGQHEANVMADYSNVSGLRAFARYAYFTQKWGIAANAFYQMYSEALTGVKGDQQIAGGELQAIVRLARLGGRDLQIIPGVQGAYETESGAFRILGTLSFRFGSLRPALPSSLTPNTASALPEDK